MPRLCKKCSTKFPRSKTWRYFRYRPLNRYFCNYDTYRALFFSSWFLAWNSKGHVLGRGLIIREIGQPVGRLCSAFTRCPLKYHPSFKNNLVVSRLYGRVIYGAGEVSQSIRWSCTNLPERRERSLADISPKIRSQITFAVFYLFSIKIELSTDAVAIVLLIIFNSKYTCIF